MNTSTYDIQCSKTSVFLPSPKEERGQTPSTSISPPPKTSSTKSAKLLKSHDVLKRNLYENYPVFARKLCIALFHIFAVFIFDYFINYFFNILWIWHNSNIIHKVSSYEFLRTWIELNSKIVGIEIRISMFRYFCSHAFYCYGHMSMRVVQVYIKHISNGTYNMLKIYFTQIFLQDFVLFNKLCHHTNAKITNK